MAQDERIYPSFENTNYALHVYRYLWAAQFAYGGDVLDAGCGSGYGAELLSLVARRVQAVDYDADVIQENESHYLHRGNLTFSQQDVTKLSLPDQAFDLTVSFEVYEHLDPAGSDAFLSDIVRVTRQGGKVLLSTPNRLVEEPFMRAAGQKYRYHINSVSPKEFGSRLRRHFRSVELFGQCISALGLKRVLRFMDPMNLRHHLLSHAAKERVELALTGRSLSTRPSLSSIRIARSSVSQCTIIVAVCQP